MFSNFLLYGSWLVAMTRILLIAAEMKQYIAVQLVTNLIFSHEFEMRHYAGIDKR